MRIYTWNDGAPQAVIMRRPEDDGAIAVLSSDDLERLCRLASLGLRNGSPEDGALVAQLDQTRAKAESEVGR
jgi:hypothetical protein